MSLKAEIETWVQALAYYDNNEFQDALMTFEKIADTSKILFNCGVIHASLGSHKLAVECYQRAVQYDQYLAVAYFQQGVSNFLMSEFEEALANFNDALLYLRGNTYIDYEQLGLKFKLYSCEILFNRGLCYIYLQLKQQGMTDLQYAHKEKEIERHNAIDDAIKDEAEGYMVFSIQVGTVFRPNAAKVKNLKSKDYLGKARLVASAAPGSSDARRNHLLDSIARDDRPAENISYAATNLVDPRLRSRGGRLQSEPPLHRQVFPPTPPPEVEKTPPPSYPTPQQRSSSATRPPVADAKATPAQPNGVTRTNPPVLKDKPKPLNLLNSNLEKIQAPNDDWEKPRVARTRTASEPRTPSSRSFGERRSKSREAAMRNLQAPRPEEKEDASRGVDSDFGRMSITSTGSKGGQRHARMSRPMSIEEVEEEDEGRDESSWGSGDNGSGDDEGYDRKRTTSRPRGTSRAMSKRPEVRKIRVKIRHAQDTRTLTISTMVSYSEFRSKVAEKLELRKSFKIRTKDEDDMITMGDQDDLDEAVSMCKKEARKRSLDVGRMEIWVTEAA